MMEETVTIQIRYLSAIRDQVGHNVEERSFPKGANLGDVKDWLNSRYPLSLPNPKIMLTLNGRGWDQLSGKLATGLREGDVIFLFPVVAGG